MKQNTKRIPAKGTSRRVVIVRGDNDSVFEQIIYIVRDDCLTGNGVSAEHVLREAVQSIHLNREEDCPEEEPKLYSRVLLVLVIIAFLLAVGILTYLHFHGWN